MDTIEFRSVTGNDANDLYTVLNSLSKEAKKFFHPHPFDKKTIKKICTSTKDHYFVLTLNKKIVGYSMLRLFGHSIPSFGVCIRDGYEKHGYGEMMTEKTIQKAKEFGYTEVILTVHKENAPALELYKKIGFTTMYQDLKTGEIKMKKPLPSFSSSGTETLRRKKAVNI